MGRILGIDFGSKRVGLALSDVGRIIAFPYKTLHYRSSSDLFERLVSLIEQLEVGKIVVGLPLGMKGQRTAQTIKVEKFVSVLEKSLSVPVDLIDERLTSTEAIRSLQRQGYKPSRDKGLIDETAATIFLQAYLDSFSSS